jgi:hypothetical protein
MFANNKLYTTYYTKNAEVITGEYLEIDASSSVCNVYALKKGVYVYATNMQDGSLISPNGGTKWAIVTLDNDEKTLIESKKSGYSSVFAIDCSSIDDLERFSSYTG